MDDLVKALAAELERHDMLLVGREMLPPKDDFGRERAVVASYERARRVFERQKAWRERRSA